MLKRRTSSNKFKFDSLVTFGNGNAMSEIVNSKNYVKPNKALDDIFQLDSSVSLGIMFFFFFFF